MVVALQATQQEFNGFFYSFILSEMPLKNPIDFGTRLLALVNRQVIDSRAIFFEVAGTSGSHLPRKYSS